MVIKGVIYHTVYIIPIRTGGIKTIPIEGYFSSEHDKAAIEAGGFFCGGWTARLVAVTSGHIHRMASWYVRVDTG